MPKDDKWVQYITRAHSAIDLEETIQIVDWKRSVGDGLRPALDAVREERSDWPVQVIDGIKLKHIAIKDSLVDFVTGAKLEEWFKSEPDDSLRAMKALWAEGHIPAGHRIRAFCDLLPVDVLAGKGTRLRPVSVLLMALGPDVFPYKITHLKEAYHDVGYPVHATRADEGTMYEYATTFLDQLVSCKMEVPKTRLEAESMVWQMYLVHKKG